MAYQSFRPNQSRSVGRSRFPTRFARRSPRRSTLDISQLIRKAQIVSDPTPYASKRTFNDFGLNAQLLQNMTHKGYLSPTQVQDQAIEPIMAGKDLLGIANTGTGKTAAFLIPILHQLMATPDRQVLIMTPTRELAVQIQKEFQELARDLRLFSALCIGGTSRYTQRQALSRRAHLVIGTPGRIKDVLQSRMLDISRFSIAILDEVDRMLDMGFVRDMRQILGLMPRERQSLFFSATISPSISSLIVEFSHELETVSVRTHETAAGIEQDVVRLAPSENKIEVLHQLLIKKEFEKVLIFGRTKRGVHHLSQSLSDRGFKADSIHGNKSQPQRLGVLTRFRQNQIRILVATDVAARGLDIDNVTHVINYDLPETYDDYIHRIGRTGRANKKGWALTFV